MTSPPPQSSDRPQTTGHAGRGELPQQERFHASVGGTMILEYPVVPNKGGGTREIRRIDSLILPSTPHLTINGSRRNVIEARELKFVHEDIHALLRTEPVICVQAKNSHLGPYLLGQALFSRELLAASGINAQRSVALCGGDVPELSTIAREEFALEVIVDPLLPGGRERRSLLRSNPEGVRAYWQSVGGAFYPKFPILQPGARGATFVDAVIVDGTQGEHPEASWLDLRGRDVTILVSTRAREGMAGLGLTVFTRALAERAGANAKAILIARDHDSALKPHREKHPNVTVIAANELPVKPRRGTRGTRLN